MQLVSLLSCFLLLSLSANAQDVNDFESEHYADWFYFDNSTFRSMTDYTVDETLTAYEDTPFDDGIKIQFRCDDNGLSSELIGVEDARFDDPADVSVKVSTYSGIKQLSLAPPVLQTDLVVEPDPSNLKMWINAIDETIELKIEITTGYAKRVHTFRTSGFSEAFSRLSCSDTFVNTLEDWQLDQAAGNYWSVDGELVLTHDPKENNPGTMFVGPHPQVGVSYVIFVSADLTFDNSGVAPVRYVFNESVEGSDIVFQDWSTIEIPEGVQLLQAPDSFADEFASQVPFGGSVEMEIVDSSGEVAHRTFVLDGFRDAWNELVGN